MTTSSDPNISDYIGKDWDSPEIQELAECTLAWFLGVRYHEMEEFEADTGKEVPSEAVYLFAARFETYVQEAVQRFLADRIESWNQGA